MISSGGSLRVLHLASYDSWTGAAAPAFTEVEALRSNGVDAHFGYVGEGSLEVKIGDLDYTHAIIDRAQTPWNFLKSASAVKKMAAQGFDLVHAHQSYDHWLAHVALRNRIPLVRTFHARRPLRRDPITKHLIARTAGLAVVNPSFLSEKPILGRKVAFTPPPVDARLFHPDGPTARPLYGLDRQPIVGVIGKITPGRGFEEAFTVFAAVHRLAPDARFLVIGRGYLRSQLQRLAQTLGIADALIWAGYREEDLPQHYRAMDAMLFTSTGSDEGHRAVSEAMACGTPVFCYPIAGIDAVTGPLTPRVVIERADPEELASRVSGLISSTNRAELRASAAAAVALFSFDPTAKRLIELYEAALSNR